MNKAYKYRTNLLVAEKKRDSIQLSNNVFYAANLRTLNDPFEGSVLLPKSSAHEHWVTPLCRELYDVGIYSLSKPKDNEIFPSNDLLWAHYANSHKGFCIEYNLDILTDNFLTNLDISDIINVTYKDERPEVNETDAVHEVRRKVFGTKSLAWGYENEIRLVFSNSGLKPVADKSILAIYFGLNISLEDRKDIVEMMSDKNIDFYQVERVDDSYKLKATKLLFDYSHKIVSMESKPTIDNYIIHYESPNKDKISIFEFVSKFRSELLRPSNITIIDDIRAKEILQNYIPRNQMSDNDIDIQSKHWIAYSSFDAPQCVWMYPEK